MLKIVPNRNKGTVAISLTRGDSAYITVNITDNTGADYTLQEGDHVHMQVRKDVDGGDLVFESQIEYGEDELVWHIVPDNTNGQDPGDYTWDAQLELSNGDVFTFIPPSLFRILDEVTVHE